MPAWQRRRRAPVRPRQPFHRRLLLHHLWQQHRRCHNSPYRKNGWNSPNNINRTAVPAGIRLIRLQVLRASRRVSASAVASAGKSAGLVSASSGPDVRAVPRRDQAAELLLKKAAASLSSHSKVNGTITKVDSLRTGGNVIGKETAIEIVIVSVTGTATEIASVSRKNFRGRRRLRKAFWSCRPRGTASFVCVRSFMHSCRRMCLSTPI